jgi:tetratricopeptide (TPR) repeat protein
MGLANVPSRSFSTGQGLPLQVIVVRTAEDAQHVLSRLQDGQDFGELARKLSIHATSDAGGYMGRFEPDELRIKLREAIKGLNPGQYTSPVQIPNGYAILKIMQRTPAQPADRARSFDLMALGAVKYLLDIGGIGEVEALTKDIQEPGWNINPHNVCEVRSEAIDETIFNSKRLLAKPGNPPRSPMDEMSLHQALAQLYAYQGKMDLATQQYEQTYEIAQRKVPQAIPEIEETLGSAYLHKAEMDNGSYKDPGKSCIFPIAPDAAFHNTADLQKAIDLFTAYLKKTPDSLEVRWLLNLSYMMLGKYPDAVPKQYLIPPTVFESKENVGRFVDVAKETGLRSFEPAGGVVVDDFENNGLLDVVTSGWTSCAPMHYFHNNGDGTFTDESQKAGVSQQVGGLNMIQADYNNDGCTDILLLRGAWEFPQRKTLLKNNCDGTFTDVTLAAGLGEPTSTQAAVWVDVNNDGWLDLFVGNEKGTAQLFINNHDGTFKNVADAAGVAGDGSYYIKGVAAADYDHDGWPDLYVSNMTGPNFLYHNNGDGTFTEVAAKAGVQGNERGFATWFFDYDNDGWPDIFVTSYFASLDETVRTYLGLPHNGTTMKLYHNNHDGTFTDVTNAVGLDKVFTPMGANFGDIDNDGYLDIYLGTGSPSYASLVPNVLLRNHDGKYFVDVTTSSGTGELHKGHGIAFADLANDGNEDILLGSGGAVIGDTHMMRVWENPGHANDWITVKLVGVKTNRSAIGARIAVNVQDEGHAPRSIYRTVGSGGSFGASPLQQHIGLGKSAKILSLDVFWPTSKTHQHFTNVDKNQFIEIKEFADNYTKLDHKPVHLGGSTSAHSARPLGGTSGAAR